MSHPIHDQQGSLVGYQDDDGTLRDRAKKKIGHINRDGAVFNAQKEQVGTISKRGDVVDRYGRQVGSISPIGTVLDWHGIEVYSGSAAPLVLDFDNFEPEPLPSRFDFDRLARQAPEVSPERASTSILPEGFVSPSVIGCVGILIAVVVGLGIMFVLQNPNFLSRRATTPTLGAVSNATPRPDSSNGTAVPDAAPTAATPQPAVGRVNTQILNLRQGPATSFEIVDRLQQDTQVVMLGRLGDNVWLKVTVPSIGKDGWVAAEYIDTNVDLSTLPEVPPPSQ